MTNPKCTGRRLLWGMSWSGIKNSVTAPKNIQLFMLGKVNTVHSAETLLLQDANVLVLKNSS